MTFFSSHRRITKILSIVLVVLILGLSIRFIFIKPGQVSAADIYLGLNEGYGGNTSDTNSTITASTVTNAVWKTEDLCKVGKCLYFDGTGDYVTHIDDATLDMGNGDTVTIEGWFRTPGITSGTRTLISKEEATGADGGYRIDMNSSGFVVFGIDNDNSTFPSDSVTSTLAYDDNEWHHFAAVKNGLTSMTLYIDAASVGTPDTSPAADVSNDDAFYIGIYNGASNGWSGFIDEVKVYRSARTAAEIKADFTGETPSRGTAASFGPDTSWISNGLVGYWKMDEAAADSCGTNDSCDSSGNDFNGAWTNNVTPAQGKFEKATYFDGVNDYINVPNNASLRMTVFTISVWIKVTSLISSFNNVINKDTNSSNRNYVISIAQATGILSGSTSFSGTNRAVSSLNSVNDSAWHHVVYVVDQDQTQYLYIDGTLNDTQTNTGTANTPTNPVRFGVDQASALDYNGYIDEARFYNRAFSPSEVAKLYNWAPGPVGWWKFDDNTGTSGVDSSTNNNTVDGTSGGVSTIAAVETVTGSVGEGGGTTVTLTSWTPGANELIILSVAMRDETKTVTASGNGITFTEIVDLDNTQGQIGVNVFRGMSSSPTTGSITVSISGNDSPTGFPVMAVATRFSGTDTSGTNGSGAIEATNTDAGPAVDNDDVKIDLTTVTANAWAFASAVHRRRTLTDPPAAGETTISLNNLAGDIGLGNETQSSTWYESVPSPTTVTLGTDNNLSLANDWALVALSIKPGTSVVGDIDWTQGKYGSAVSLSGNNQLIYRNDDADFDFADDADMTISTWFKHDTASTQEIIMSKYNEAGYKIIMESDGDITCALDYDSDWTPTDSITTTAATYDDNNWHHVACVKTGASTLSVFIDGVLIGTDPTISATNTLTNSDPLYLGINADGTSNDFIGLLDDVKIYNYARTSSQVVEDMNAGHPAPGSPVGSALVHWKFDEGHDATVNNSSNRVGSLNGTITSGTWSNSGKYNKALTFTASTSVTTTIADPAYLNAISLWVYPTTSIASKTLVTATKFITDSSSRPTYGSCVGTALALSTWTHIVAVSNGSGSCAIYQNGKVTSTGTTGVTFGTSINIGGSSYIGSIDEFKFYNFPLTADQVKLLYNQSTEASFGALSTDSSNLPSNSDTDSYCPPGQGSACVGPVGHWKFDENTGTTSVYDSSGNGNTGTISNFRSWSPGKVGSSLEFNNADTIVNVGTATILDKLKDTGLTAEAWIYPKAAHANGSRIFDKSSAGGGNRWIYSLNANGTSLQFTHSCVTTDLTSSSANTITLNNWQHVAVTWTGGTTAATVLFYLNGVLQSTSGTLADCVDGLRDDNLNDLSIGDTNATDPRRPFNGFIDDAKIYNYVRTPAQLAWDYNRGEPVAWWKMDDCTGNTLYDSSLLGTGASGGKNGTRAGTSGTNTSSGTCTAVDTATAWYNGRTGKFNGSLDFDGGGANADDEVTVSNASAIDLNEGLKNGFTYSAWIYPESDGEGDAGRIFDKGNTYCKLGSESGGQATVSCTVDLATDTVFSATTKVTIGTWNHVAFSWTNDSDDEVTIWVNGIANTSSASFDGDAAEESTDLTIGNIAAQSSTFDGKIDDFRVFGYELTAQQVKTVMNAAAVRFGQ